MPDPERTYTLLNQDGTPADPTPDLAVASQYRKGNVKFAPGGRVPVTVNGQSGTVASEELDDAVQNYGAELNIGDPLVNAGSAAAWGVLGGVPGLTRGLIWTKKHLLNDPTSAEYMRKEAEAAEEEHPGLYIGSGLAAGAALTGGPGALEKLGLTGAAGAAAGATVADATGAAAKAGAVLSASAEQGRTVGSSVAKIFRAANPYEWASKAGEAVAGAGSGLGSKVLRWGTEGAVLGALGSLDESAIGNHEVTAESILSEGVLPGALFNSTLGLVGTGIGKMVTGAGRIANRIAQSHLGGTPSEIGAAAKRFGPDTIGFRVNEEGLTGQSNESKYEQLKNNIVPRDGKYLEEVVRGADAAYYGAEVGPLLSKMDKVADEQGEKMSLAAGNDAGQRLAEKLKSDARETFGWMPEPPRPEPIPDSRIEQVAEAMRQDAGVPVVDPQKPPDYKKYTGAWDKQWRMLAEDAGLGTRPERIILGDRIPSRMSTDYVEWKDSYLKNPAEMQRLGREYGFAADGGPNFPKAYITETNQEISERNQQRMRLRNVAGEQLFDQFEQDRKAFLESVKANRQILDSATAKVTAERAAQDAQYTQSLDLARRNNVNATASMEKLREWRIKLDKTIPAQSWASPTRNATDEMRKAMRQVVENHVEESMERAAVQSDRPELPGLYEHAKQRYAQSKTMLEMADRGRNKELAQYGRMTKFGMAAHTLGVVTALASGHPIVAAASPLAMSMGRKYASPVAAAMGHKVARIAELRAIRTEVEVAMRRSVRAAAAEAPSATARVALPDLPPHELRATAAEAMGHVMRAGAEPGLTSRLAALTPGLEVLSPKTHQAVQGSARRIVSYMASRIPTHVLHADKPPEADDLTDAQAKSFLESAAIAQDARYAPDMAAKGSLTPQAAMDYRAMWPTLAGNDRATLQRMTQAGKDPYMPKMLVGQPPKLPGYALALQQHAAQLAAGSAPQMPAKGMTHASAGNKQLTAGASGLATMSQMVESGTPGKRGRAGRTAGALGVF